MNESLPPAGLLKAAAQLIDRALAGLNGQTEFCPACGVRHYRDYTEGKIVEQLGATPERLRNAAGRLENQRAELRIRDGSTRPAAAEED